MSLGSCNGRVSKLSIVAVDPTHDNATWFTLNDQLSPRASNLKDRGLVADASDWTLHATF